MSEYIKVDGILQRDFSEEDSWILLPSGSGIRWYAQLSWPSGRKVVEVIMESFFISAPSKTSSWFQLVWLVKCLCHHHVWVLLFRVRSWLTLAWRCLISGLEYEAWNMQGKARQGKIWKFMQVPGLKFSHILLAGCYTSETVRKRRRQAPKSCIRSDKRRSDKNRETRVKVIWWIDLSCPDNIYLSCKFIYDVASPSRSVPSRCQLKTNTKFFAVGFTGPIKASWLGNRWAISCTSRINWTSPRA